MVAFLRELGINILWEHPFLGVFVVFFIGMMSFYYFVVIRPVVLIVKPHSRYQVSQNLLLKMNQIFSGKALF